MPEVSRQAPLSTTKLSMPSRERYATFVYEELSPSSPLTQVQRMAGWRPVLMIGEGSHRTHEFFTLQAQIAEEAISRGCRQLCIEIPQIVGAELNEIVRSGGGREKIGELVATSFYPTLSDRSIVSLIEKVYDHNRSRTKDLITVHGLDPQAVGVVDRLSACLVTLRGSARADFRELSEAWCRFSVEESRYFDILRDRRRSQSSKDAQFEKMQGPRESCEAMACALLKRGDLTVQASGVISAMMTHLDLRSLPMQDSMESRDRMMARRILDALPNVPTVDSLEAPLAVVLAHNAHVSFGPRGEAGGWFSDGMGSYVREELAARGFGDNACTVMCQVSLTGRLGLLPCDPSSMRRKGNVGHPAMIDGELQLLPAQLAGKPVLVRFAQQAEGVDSGFELKLRQFGAINPRKSTFTFSIKPEGHMTLLVVHPETGPADWVSNPWGA